MAKRQPITVVGYLHIRDENRTVRMDELTEIELESCRKNFAKRMGEVLSDYYTTHPEEFIKLQKINDRPREMSLGDGQKEKCLKE